MYSLGTWFVSGTYVKIPCIKELMMMMMMMIIIIIITTIIIITDTVCSPNVVRTHCTSRTTAHRSADLSYSAPEA
jgi:hypothetical protein